jgi:predicted MFS family arabinose efflux permease
MAPPSASASFWSRLGGVVGSVWGPTAPAFVAAGLGLLNLVLAYWRLPETRRPGAPSHARRGILDIRALADAVKFKNVPQLFAIYFVFTTGFALMETALALFLEHEFVDKAILGSTAGHEQANPPPSCCSPWASPPQWCKAE